MLKFKQKGEKFFMSYKNYTVDRIEENMAVVFDDDDKKSDIHVSALPENLKEGDILCYDDENKTYTIDREQTSQVKASIDERFKKLFKK